MLRQRLTFLAATLLVMACGLASRRYSDALPEFLATYTGDTLWALMVYCGIGVLLPQLAPLRKAAIAACFATTIEVSQLYHAPWIDTIRSTTVGGLVLGFGFLWSDLVCYAVGIAIGASADQMLRTATIDKHR